MASAKQKESLMNRTRVIADVQESLSVTATILNESKIGLDLEGMDLGVDGQVSLVTMALQNGNIYIFDVYSCPMIMFDGKVHEVLESERILKVMHGAFGDAGGLLSNFNVRLKNVYDTQCAFTALQLSDPRLLDNDLVPHTIGLNDLLKFYKIAPNSAKSRMQNSYRGNPHIWKTRPLTDDMLHYAAADVDALLGLFHRMTKEYALKQNRLLLDNLIYETLFNHVVPLTIRKRRQFRQNQLRRWRTDLNGSKRLFPYIEDVNPKDHLWRNDYNAHLANAKLMHNNPINRMYHKEKDSHSEEKIELIDTKTYQSFNKKFYFDIKQSKTTKFIKISEVNMDQTRNQIHISLSVVGHLRDHLNALLTAHQNTPKRRHRETHTLKSEVLIKDTRRYYLDLKDNGRARFVTMSQLLPVGGKLSSIAFPVQDLVPLLGLLEDIQAEHGSPEDEDRSLEGNYMRCKNKRFFFNVSKNEKGTFMRISEVVPPTYRASITIPQQSWHRFIETFHATSDLYESAESSTSRPDSQCDKVSDE
uniref:Transcriptional activator protein Pur-alpha n=1 Tax=Cacopsylla melanoneura TaxID=428564 RepID=A0A8D9APH0_9HEMI